AALPWPAYGRRVARPADPGCHLVLEVDRKERAARRDARHSPAVNQLVLPAMNQLVIAVLWAIVGAAAGLGLRWGSVKLARLEGLEPGSKWWQRFGPPVLAAVVFAVYGYALSPFGILLVRSVFALVL